MRIVVSGTHASGKSTLISDFALQHPEFTVLPDPFELIDEGDAPLASVFASQLRIAAGRLTNDTQSEHLIAERGPLDFLAYLVALAELTDEPLDGEFFRKATALTADAMHTVDLLVVLPLTSRDMIHVSADEHLELRAAMNDVLLELIHDPDLVGGRPTVVEITGDPAARLSALDALTASAS